MEKSVINKVQNKIPLLNYGFFVRKTRNRYDPETGVETSFLTWELNEHKKDIAWIVDCENIRIDTFLETCSNVYEYVECVYAPEKGKYTLLQINEKLGLIATIQNEIPTTTKKNKL